MPFVKFILCFLLMFSMAFNQTFYKIFQNDNGKLIRRITTNEPFLAIVTEYFIIFGSVENEMRFTEICKANLTKKLIGNDELLEFKFINNDTVIICNYVECSICGTNKTCSTIISLPIKSINAQVANDMQLFLRVIHEKNNATIYSFQFQKNGKYEEIGKSIDRTTDINEFRSLYSFSHGNHLYFVTQIKREDLVMCLTAKKSFIGTDIVVTQICNNDFSKDIATRMDLVISCGNFPKRSNSTSLPPSGKFVLENVNTFHNNVTGVSYLSQHGGKLLFSLQDSSNFSFMCEFNIGKIEEKFCNTWNYCQNIFPCHDCSIPKLKGCKVEKEHINGCFELMRTYRFSMPTQCDSKTVASSNPQPISYSIKGFQLPRMSYCDPIASLIKQKNFNWTESFVTVYGKLLPIMSFKNKYGNIFSSANQLYISNGKKLIKKTQKIDGLISYHELHGLPIVTTGMLMPWDSKDGIIYVDPVTKNSIYFKEVICRDVNCLDILHTTNLECSLCDDNYPDECNETKIYCNPIWQNINVSHIENIIFAYGGVVVDKQNISIKLNGVKRIVQCNPAENRKSENCTNIIADYFAPHFIGAVSANGNSIFILDIVSPVLLAIFAFGGILIVTFVFIVLCLLSRHKKRITKNRGIMETINSEPLYLDALINKERIVILQKRLGSGNFGYVDLGKYKEDNGETKKVAVKTLHCSRGDVIKEVKALSLCKHKNIVTYIGWMEIGDKKCIITEYMPGGDLRTFLKNPQKTLFISTIFSYIFQILDAMIYLSEKHILHRDLAARNCLLDKPCKILKISDFGLARKMDINYEYLAENSRKLPVQWLPLEALKSVKFTVKGDIWSFAVLIWEMFERGNFPYKNIDFITLILSLESGERLYQPQHCPERLYEIMKECWKKTPEDRPTFKKLQTEIAKLFHQLRCSNSDILNTEVHLCQN